MQELSTNLRNEGKTIGFVPTMGYLHEGHLSLVRKARKENDILVVSIFVNPTQFGPGEDFKKYPRDLERDKSLLQKENVDILFNPIEKEMYPEDFSTYVEETSLTRKWEGEKRPGHFRGVTTIVTKLFHIVLPHRAYFGEKDWQQMLVIKKMVQDLNFPLEIISCPTIRENDGLAMSSRNTYLSPEGRKSAIILYRVLKKGEKLIKESKKNVKEILRELVSLIQKEAGAELDYLALVDPETMEPIDKLQKRNLIIIACRIEGTRLIDNLLVEISS